MICDCSSGVTERPVGLCGKFTTIIFGRLRASSRNAGMSARKPSAASSGQRVTRTPRQAAMSWSCW